MYKKHLKAILALAVIVLGIYMMLGSAWPDTSFAAGLGFLLVGLGQWVSHCPICNKICKG